MTTSLSAALTGAPRVSRYPDHGSSAGQEAIELAATAGLNLDPWQRGVLQHALGEREDGTWSSFEVAVVVSRQNGKGALLEARELAGLVLFGEQLILHSAHEMKTASEAFRRVRDLFTNYDDLRRRVVKVTLQRGDEGIELKNGARLRFVARSSGSGRGFSGDCVILDEAYAVTADQIDAMLPTLSARPNPQLWYTSSPPLDGVTGDQLFSLRDRALAGSASVAYFDFGTAGDLDNLDEIDLDDRSLWQAANPAWGIRISERFVAAEREALTDVGFARERLGVWPKRVVTGAGVIDLKLWKELATTVEGGGRPPQLVFAVVVEADRRYTAIVAIGAQADGRIQLSTVAYEPGTEWVVERMQHLRDRWSPVLWAIEDKGATSSLWPELERAGFKAAEDRDEPKRGDIVVPWAHEVAAAYGMFIDHLTQRKLAHLADRALDAAVNVAETRPLGSGTTWDHRGQVAALRAATNGLGSWVTFADKVAAAVNPWDHVY